MVPVGLHPKQPTNEVKGASARVCVSVWKEISNEEIMTTVQQMATTKGGS